MSPIYLPKPIANYFNGQVQDLFQPKGMSFDFKSSQNEGALYEPDSLAWQAYKNPVTVFIGGVSAVCMQLAEPRVRSGVWEHSNFKEQTKGRIQRTGLAAMMTVYGPKSQAEKMISHVNRMHERVRGITPDGQEYSAADPELLSWVFNTANYGFLTAHNRFGPGSSKAEIDESLVQAADNVAHLWGVNDAVRSTEEAEASFDAMLPNLESHAFLDEFMEVIKKADLMPAYMRPVQRLLIRAAVSNMPDDVRVKVGLDKHGLRPGEETLVKMMGRLADKVYLESLPAVHASERMGLPSDYLYRSANDNDDVDIAHAHDVDPPEHRIG